jgi:ABC-type amino acid transport substrate-binding protein
MVGIASGVWQDQWDIAIASLTPFDQPAASSATEMIYSMPYGYMPMGFLAASNSNLETVSQLAGRRVGVFEHSAYQRLLTPEEGALTVQGQSIMVRPLPEVQLIVLSNLQQTIRELGQSTPGEATPADVIFGPIPILEQAIRADLAAELALNGQRIGIQPLAIALTPQHNLKVDRLQTEINTIIERARHQGVLSEIYFRWYRRDLSQPPPAE